MSEPSFSPSNPSHSRDVLWNFLTALVVVALIVAFIIIALIYINPRSTLNPFPPPTAVPTLAAITQTPPPTKPQSATVTATPPVSQATRTNTPPQPNQPTPTAILATPAVPSGGGSPTPTAKSNATYTFAPIVISAMSADVYSPGRGCQWMGVAGLLRDIKDSPIPLGIAIRLAGILDGKQIFINSLTGTAVQYDISGYEIFLAEKPIASKNSLWIQLLDQAGLPLSDRVYFDTFADCSKNLIIINFKQVK